jgi:hypothetical protein
VPRRSPLWLFLLLASHRLPAQEREAPPPDSSAAQRADSLPAPPAPPAPADSIDVAALTEGGTPAGYEASLHGIQGLDVGHLDRVDGWTPAVGVTLEPVRPNALPTLDLAIGVRTSRPREPFTRFSATQIFPGLDRLRVAVEGYRSTRTPDDWKVGPRENDIWVLLAHQDLRNYYQADGARLAVSSSDLRPWGLALSLLLEDQRSIEADAFPTLPSAFGEEENFRANPAIAEGRMASATLDARLVTASSQSPALRVPGWNLGASLERAGSALGGDQTFWRGMLDLHRYTRLSDRHWVNARLYLTGPVLGTRTLPRQRFTYLGGPGSLPGFDPLEIAGDRGALGTVEYTFQLPNTSWSTPVFLLWQLELFSDVGGATSRAGDLLSDLHWDAGAGVSGVTVLGYLGLFFAQRVSDLDQSSAGPRLFFRLQRAF